MRIALFVTCLNDALFPRVGIATVTVLERLGHTVTFPAGQSCCGQLHANTGYPGPARALEQSTEAAFAGHDVVVSPSGSCVAHLRAHTRLPVYELSELLVDVLAVTDVGARFPYRVTYHPTCHGLRMLRLGDRPLRLLGAVRDLELLGLPEPEQCCGFGGTFALKNAAVSGAMLADKCAHAVATGADYLAAADSSCLAHIGGGLARRPGAPRPVHYAEILAATGAGAVG
ncbi:MULTISPECIES: (Fe-S)-binding protein [Micromonospora]|uniref:(Fe-S)-binding protein n=1 Tax=Micromonospora antibiotica TaxID=2807623 RepID=A0ABS3V6C7_9ACTN|nr:MULTISPECIES: (Fe-S)-binding protein [Micromonospora]MBO4161154.1 (Fe-S)-binding protein [Micromonospora antibiotica]MBW4701697.1 (Fe-S)-binding protein [Micromonospora sp. RL09-050-HVF-A]